MTKTDIIQIAETALENIKKDSCLICELEYAEYPLDLPDSRVGQAIMVIKRGKVHEIKFEYRHKRGFWHSIRVEEKTI